jgi:hypothetical protein
MTTLRHKYNVQRLTAAKRNIDWHFTYDTWIEWWGEDIINRGKSKGQLVMARYSDTGPYHPDNVRKATTGENVKEAHTGKPKGNSNSLNKILVSCPHCGTTTNRGNAKQWHFDNCKKRQTKDHKYE